MLLLRDAQKDFEKQLRPEVQTRVDETSLVPRSDLKDWLLSEDNRSAVFRLFPDLGRKHRTPLSRKTLLASPAGAMREVRRLAK